MTFDFHRRAGITTRVLLAAAGLLLPLAVGCGRMPTSPAAKSALVPRALGSSSSTTAANSYDPTQVVWWSNDSSQEEAVEAEHGLERVASIGLSQICRVPNGSDPLLVAQQLLLDPRVGYAEPNYLLEPAETRGHSWAFDDGYMNAVGYEDQAATTRLGLTQAHQISTGSGVLVAVLDTGVNPLHSLLRGRVLGGYDFVSNDADAGEAPDGIDSDGDGLVDEGLGHGTHVAGIVALTAPGARILPVRVLDDDGRGSSLDVSRGIDYAISRGARVINLSLGMLVEDRLIEDAVTRATAAGSLVVASAGNWGAEKPEEYPANFDEAAAVAATRADDTPAPFTSFGGFVALSAPGEGVRSAYWNGNTAVWSGTSMSAPFVAGGAALLLAVHPTWTRLQVMARLAQTAHPFDSSVPEASSHYGAGRLDLAAALLPDRKTGAGGGATTSRPVDSP